LSVEVDGPSGVADLAAVLGRSLGQVQTCYALRPSWQESGSRGTTSSRSGCRRSTVVLNDRCSDKRWEAAWL